MTAPAENARGPVRTAGPEQPLLRRFLAIRIADRAYALRLSELAGLVADKKIVRAPSSDPTLCGVAGYRGQVLAVRDLQALCGFGRATAMRWLAIARVAPVAFAFSAIERHIDAESDAAILPMTGAAATGARLRLQTRDFSGPIIDLDRFIKAADNSAAEPSSDDRA